jgi:hypothetical protein
MCIRLLVERTADPHSTSLRAGSPLRYAPVPRHAGAGVLTMGNCRCKLTPGKATLTLCQRNEYYRFVSAR